MTNCITSLPSAFSTATEMVSRWTSRPTYLMLFIGCSFRQAWLTASHSSHSLLRKGRPFIMRAPGSPFFWANLGTWLGNELHTARPALPSAQKSEGGCPVPAGFAGRGFRSPGEKTHPGNIGLGGAPEIKHFIRTPTAARPLSRSDRVGYADRGHQL